MCSSTSGKRKYTEREKENKNKVITVNNSSLFIHKKKIYKRSEIVVEFIRWVSHMRAQSNERK